VGITQLGLVAVLNLEMANQQSDDRVNGLTLVRVRVFLVEFEF
jgi:hypothetical protein